MRACRWRWGASSEIDCGVCDAGFCGGVGEVEVEVGLELRLDIIDSRHLDFSKSLF